MIQWCNILHGLILLNGLMVYVIWLWLLMSSSTKDGQWFIDPESGSGGSVTSCGGRQGFIIYLDCSWSYLRDIFWIEDAASGFPGVLSHDRSERPDGQAAGLKRRPYLRSKPMTYYWVFKAMSTLNKQQSFFISTRELAYFQANRRRKIEHGPPRRKKGLKEAGKVFLTSSSASGTCLSSGFPKV